MYEPIRIPIESRNSLVHLGSLDSFDITSGGKKAGKLILKYLEDHDPDHLNEANDVYDRIIPNENFGGEYTALQWLCRFWLAPEEAREELLAQPTVRGFYELLTQDDSKNLKEYLELKYHVREKTKGDVEETARLRFLEDFILFCNPDRERWEKTRANLEKLNIQPGERIADVGSGSGYYSFKFADIVGPEGKVYAIETNPRHLDYLRGYIEKNRVDNVEAVVSSFDGIGLSPEIRVDTVFMCSLYHNVYAAFTDYERDHFVETIRRALVDNGKLIIVDNDLVAGEDIPYHGPYINKQLIVGQLLCYGFEMIDTYQFTPQRYVLVFRKIDPVVFPEKKETAPENTLEIRSASSVIRYRIIGTRTSGYTIRGKRVGKLFYEGLVRKDRDLIRQARDGFADLWPQERIGDEYTAHIWFCDWILGDEATREAMLADKLNSYYFHYFADDDFATLKQYLLVKFDLERPEPENASLELNYDYEGDFSIAQLNEWNEFLIFNNPNRVLWEHTDRMISEIGLKPGMSVADIGCGGGYFTWRFAKMVGDTGMVYATEINADALKYLETFKAEAGADNILPKVTRMNEAGLPKNSVDVIYMCSMYHAVYITDIEFVKDSFIGTVKKALRPGGRLVIADNDVTPPGVPSYYGPGILKELIISQLYYYGFELVHAWQEVPQRFLLVFELKNPDMGRPTSKDKLKGSLRKLGDRFQKRQPERPE